MVQRKINILTTEAGYWFTVFDSRGKTPFCHRSNSRRGELSGGRFYDVDLGCLTLGVYDEGKIDGTIKIKFRCVGRIYRLDGKDQLGLHIGILDQNIIP